MIRKVVLRNWRSHEETVVEFGKGTNILVGIMGSGKSSLLEAMAFALFGKFPAMLHRKVKLSQVIMSRPVEKSEASVELWFGWDGAEYSVRRVVNRKGAGEAELRKGIALLMSEPEKVTEEIERLLGIDYDLFYRAIYAEQNRMDYFLGLNPMERKKQIDELLGIDRFEAARSTATTVANSLRRMKEERGKELLAMNAEEIGARAAKAKAEIAGLVKEKDRISTGLVNARNGRKKAEELLSSLDALRIEWETLGKRSAGLGHLASELKADIARREKSARGIDFAAVEKEEKEAATEETGLKKELRAASARLAELRGKEGELKYAVSELKSRLKARGELEAFLAKNCGVKGAEEKLGKLAGEKDLVSRAIAELSAKERELRSSLAELAKGGGACPVCERELNAELREELLGLKNKALVTAVDELAGKKAGLSSLEKEISSAEKALAETRLVAGRLAELEDAEKSLLGAESLLKIASAAGAKAAEDSTSAEKKLDAHSARLRELRERLSAAKEIESAMKRLAETETQLAEAGARLAKLEFEPKRLDNARKEAEEWRAKELGLGGELRLAEEMERSAKERLESAEKELAACEERKSGLKKLERAAENIMVLQSSLVETQAALRSELVEAVNSTMAELWPIIYPYGDYKEIALVAGEDDYSLELQVGGAWLPVEGFASGGERACASLTLRIALAMAIVPGLKWLVLDEPTHNLDEQGIRSLVEVLHERIPEIVEQIFVITHDEEMKDAASARVYRFDRNKETNEPTRVLELS